MRIDRHDSDPRPRLTGPRHRLRLEAKRRRLLWRIFRGRRALSRVSHRTATIGPEDILLFACVKDEIAQLPGFLAHHRALGVGHMLIVDNGSTDGSAELLRAQPDVSLWRAEGSYKAARFGMDWLGALHWKYGAGHWCLTVDADERFVYPDAPARDLPRLAADLDARGIAAMGALMLDLYPRGPVSQARPGGARYFDATGYHYQPHPWFGNDWIQGGPRERAFFARDPSRAPTLNKTPFLRWRRDQVYVTSTHQILPANLGRSFDIPGGTRPSGVLLHHKFEPQIVRRAADPAHRAEHFEAAGSHADYYDALARDPDLWSDRSMEYRDPAQLLDLGLMDRGGLPVLAAQDGGGRAWAG